MIKIGGLTSITPTQLFSDGSIPGSIAGTVTIRNATADGQAVALGGSGLFGQPGAANLILDHATLGPDLRLTVSSAAAAGPQTGTLTVQGSSTNYGQIEVVTPDDAQTPENGNRLVINLQPGAQLNQEGTLAVISPQTTASPGSLLSFAGSGTLNNDGQILVGPGSEATFGDSTIGSGTITVDHARASLFSAASTQTLDLLGGTVSTSVYLQAMIKDWDSSGSLVIEASVVSSVQFNQTSDAGGDLQLFDGARQVGDLHLLGAYATSDFTVTESRTDVTITASGKAPPSA